MHFLSLEQCRISLNIMYTCDACLVVTNTIQKYYYHDPKGETIVLSSLTQQIKSSFALESQVPTLKDSYTKRPIVLLQECR